MDKYYAEKCAAANAAMAQQDYSTGIAAQQFGMNQAQQQPTLTSVLERLHSIEESAGELAKLADHLADRLGRPAPNVGCLSAAAPPAAGMIDRVDETISHIRRRLSTIGDRLSAIDSAIG